MLNYRRTTQGAADVTFANPSDMLDRTRVVVKASPKTVGSVQRTNVRSEVITTGRTAIEADATCCGPMAYDATSIRTSISGSLENKVAVLAKLDQHLANLAVVRADLVSGFVPYDAVMPLIAAA